MNKIDIHVYGVHRRDHMIKRTVDKLCLSYDNVHYDDRPKGGSVIYTAKKAWLAPVPDGVTHRVALADDVEVCDGFWVICERMVNAHPDVIISLFPRQFMECISKIEGQDTPYFLSPHLFGAAIIMPVKYIEPCFNYIKEVFDDNIPDDEGIHSWADTQGIKILTTVPATIQHIGDETLVQPFNFIRRTVYYDPNPVANWDSRDVLKYTEREWLFSNRGKRNPENGFITRFIAERS